jgi:hypothetical protein
MRRLGITPAIFIEAYWKAREEGILGHERNGEALTVLIINSYL